MKYWLLPALFLLFIKTSPAQIPETVKTEVQLRVDNTTNPSIAIGISDSLGQHFFVYGYKDTEHHLKADKNTLYEIGSITKTFTGLLLASMSIEGLLDPKEAVSEFLPDNIELKDPEGKPVNLKQLATHSSGLPRLSDNLDPSTPEDPYKNYSWENMLQYLKTYSPSIKSKGFSYSNLGFGLLGEILGSITGGTYTSTLRKKVIIPLQLEHTYIQVPEQSAKNLASPYQGTTKVSPWHFKAYAGAGALKSTIEDLLKYGCAYLDKSSPLADAMELAGTIQFTDQRKDNHGYAWFLDQKGRLYHEGGTGGFRSYICIDKNTGRVITILTNTATGDLNDLFLHLIDPEINPILLSKETPVTAEELKEYTGTYINDAYGMQLLLSPEENHLISKLTGQPPYPIYYRGENSFFYKVVNASIIIDRDEFDNVVGLILKQNGQELLFIKSDTE
ncbi:serine hydrolase domain-containing protein [Robertkochia solimangrovi]|uniref:serine hydrolase domain-containing protein n=1 Tax=Robertkochia solimangrovi TaxID=2213046 RepID=UPI00117DF2DD|nr:serine hydrolase domain-containing protein [Robertkochia solimangrovi]TRZ41781.1 penicillin-binding protein [Robertkochia solimangrovi]